MADTALFSSFHRPRPPISEPIREVPSEATIIHNPPDPEPPAALETIEHSGEESDPVATPGLLLDLPVSEATAVDHPSFGADRPELSSWVDLTGIPLESDQLGLANPVVISVVAHLPDYEPVPLEAATSGIYRPPSFRPAPWSGFAYDQASDVMTGLAAGTRILTARGEIEVERLMPGDVALALRSPALLPISWIGRSVVAGRPIWIEPGALGPNIPRRPLCLGPDQPVFIKPIPVAAHTLVNGTTIREADGEISDLFHVDVGRAEILFAEGIPLSSSNRASLRNE